MDLTDILLSLPGEQVGDAGGVDSGAVVVFGGVQGPCCGSVSAHVYDLRDRREKKDLESELRVLRVLPLLPGLRPNEGLIDRGAVSGRTCIESGRGRTLCALCPAFSLFIPPLLSFPIWFSNSRAYVVECPTYLSLLVRSVPSTVRHLPFLLAVSPLRQAAQQPLFRRPSAPASSAAPESPLRSPSAPNTHRRCLFTWDESHIWPRSQVVHSSRSFYHHRLESRPQMAPNPLPSRPNHSSKTLLLGPL